MADETTPPPPEGDNAVGIGATTGRFDGIGCLAMVDDARLLGRDWGFRLADVKVPVRWWHGDTDHVVPIAGVQTAVSRMQDAELTLRSESHLGGFAKIDQVLQHIHVYL